MKGSEIRAKKRSGIWKAIDNKRTERKTFPALSSCETEKSAESPKVEVSIKTLIEINANSKMFLDPTPQPSWKSAEIVEKIIYSSDRV